MKRKYVYKITYPNGKIYVGCDLLGVGSLTYFGSLSAAAKGLIAAENDECRLDFRVRKEILWESETASDAEVRAMEIKLIRDPGRTTLSWVTTGHRDSVAVSETNRVERHENLRS